MISCDSSVKMCSRNKTQTLYGSYSLSLLCFLHSFSPFSSHLFTIIPLLPSISSFIIFKFSQQELKLSIIFISYMSFISYTRSSYLTYLLLLCYFTPFQQSQLDPGVSFRLFERYCSSRRGLD